MLNVNKLLQRALYCYCCYCISDALIPHLLRYESRLNVCTYFWKACPDSSEYYCTSATIVSTAILQQKPICQLLFNNQSQWVSNYSTILTILSTTIVQANPLLQLLFYNQCHCLHQYSTFKVQCGCFHQYPIINAIVSTNIIQSMPLFQPIFYNQCKCFQNYSTTNIIVSTNNLKQRIPYHLHLL